jgi:hypothetical protein
MWTGRQTLHEIEGALTKLRRDESELDSALASATGKAERLRRERTDALKELARVKLDEMAAGRLSRNLDAAEARAAQILESRRLRVEAIGEQRERAVKEVEQTNAARSTLAADVENAVAAVEDVRVEAEARLKGNAAWIDAHKTYDAAEAIAAEAEKKAAQSEAELGEKKKPYDADPLFAYLWGNGFGTARYQAGNIARMMDRLVADFIGFPEARSSYAMLTEIPVRLREHANLQRQAADAAKAEIAGIERQVMVAAGIEPKERALAEARHKLASVDAEAERKRTALKELEATRNSLINTGSDAAYAEALQTIAGGDAQDDVSTLYREAKRTATTSDDLIVQRISGLDEQIVAIEKEAADLRRSARELADRRGGVEQVRDRFRNSGFDHPNATFRNDSDISNVLGQILEGAVRSGILWDLLRGGFGARPSRSRPDFGAPTFPFPFPMPGGGDDGARGGEWREPGTRGGWSPPFEFPSGGRSGGDNKNDDFTTGGSF